MAMSPIQQKLILQAQLNLDPASQRKISRALGEDIGDQLMEAAAKAGMSLSAGTMRAIGSMDAAQQRMEDVLAKSEKMHALAEQSQRRVLDSREKLEKTADQAARARLEEDIRKHESIQATRERMATVGLAEARANFDLQMKAIKQTQLMYEGVDALQEARAKRDEELYKDIGREMGVTLQQHIGEVATLSLGEASKFIESPSIEGAIDSMKNVLHTNIKKLLAATKEGDGKLTKAMHSMALKMDGALRERDSIIPASALEIPTALVKLMIKFMEARARLAKGFTESTPTLMYQQRIGGRSAGLAHTSQIAQMFGIPYEEAARMVGEAATANVDLNSSLATMVSTAKSLGLGVSEVAEQTTKLNSNFKTTGRIFEQTAQFAIDSGLSIQSAYSILTGITSGVQLNNFNLKKSIGYVRNLVRVFGEELGAQLAQATGQFRGMSLTDAVKEVLLMGEDKALSLVKGSLAEMDRTSIKRSGTPQQQAALAMLERGESGGLENLAIAIRHLTAMGELRGEGLRGSVLGLGRSPAEQSFMELAAGQAVLSRDTDFEVRRQAIVQAGERRVFSSDTTEQNLRSLDATTKSMAESVRTLDESIQRLSGALTTANRTPTMGEIGAAVGSILFVRVPTADLPGAIADIEGLAPAAPPVQDFIYRGGASGGRITPINTKDQFLGMKPGGPVDIASRSAPGGNTFHFHINGNDSGKIYSVVKSVLQESGIRPPPGGRVN